MGYSTFQPVAAYTCLPKTIHVFGESIDDGAMIHDFCIHHTVLCLMVIGIILMLSGSVDYALGLPPTAYFRWFLGGALCIASLSCYIVGYVLWLSLFRWPIAVTAFFIGMYAVLHFRPKNR